MAPLMWENGLSVVLPEEAPMLKLLPCPVSGQHRCKERDCELHYMLGPVVVADIKAVIESTWDLDWSIVDLSPEARVRRGLAHVQRMYPLAVKDILRAVVDTMTLDRCVLGQIHGHFERSPEARNATTWWLQAHGFVPLVVDTITEAEDAYELDLVWRKELTDWFDEATA